MEKYSDSTTRELTIDHGIYEGVKLTPELILTQRMRDMIDEQDLEGFNYSVVDQSDRNCNHCDLNNRGDMCKFRTRYGLNKDCSIEVGGMLVPVAYKADAKLDPKPGDIITLNKDGDTIKLKVEEVKEECYGCYFRGINGLCLVEDEDSTALGSCIRSGRTDHKDIIYKLMTTDVMVNVHKLADSLCSVCGYSHDDESCYSTCRNKKKKLCLCDMVSKELDISMDLY
jgi:hypothetical protein